MYLFMCLFYKNKVLLNIPVSSKLEYFKILNQLERDIEGQADCALFDNCKILYTRKTNFTPQFIVNPEDKKKYEFTYFLNNLHKFPKDLWMLYYNYHKLKSLQVQYGF